MNINIVKKCACQNIICKIFVFGRGFVPCEHIRGDDAARGVQPTTRVARVHNGILRVRSVADGLVGHQAPRRGRPDQQADRLHFGTVDIVLRDH